MRVYILATEARQAPAVHTLLWHTLAEFSQNCLQHHHWQLRLLQLLLLVGFLSCCCCRSCHAAPASRTICAACLAWSSATATSCMSALVMSMLTGCGAAARSHWRTSTASWEQCCSRVRQQTGPIATVEQQQWWWLHAQHIKPRRWMETSVL